MTELPARPDGRRRTRVLSDKYLLALDTMVWLGVGHLEAAEKLGIPARQMRRLMGRPTAVQYLREQKAALRSSLGPKILHRLESLAMQDVNRAAAVRACLAIERAPENEQLPRHGALTAGFVIVLREGQVSAPVVIDGSRTDDVPLPASESLVRQIGPRVDR
jgi:hypothetical protein